jgi:hypothetical protein
MGLDSFEEAFSISSLQILLVRTDAGPERKRCDNTHDRCRDIVISAVNMAYWVADEGI